MFPVVVALVYCREILFRSWVLASVRRGPVRHGRTRRSLMYGVSESVQMDATVRVAAAGCKFSRTAVLFIFHSQCVTWTMQIPWKHCAKCRASSRCC